MSSGKLVNLAEIQVPILPLQNFMPPGGLPFDVDGSIATPAVAAGVDVVVLQFQVPQGMNGYIHYIANMCDQGGFNDYSGNLIWKIYTDFQNGKGPVAPGYQNMLASRGTIASPSYSFGIKIVEFAFPTFTVQNTDLPPAGVIAARLVGYFYPKELEQANLGF